MACGVTDIASGFVDCIGLGDHTCNLVKTWLQSVIYIYVYTLLDARRKKRSTCRIGKSRQPLDLALKTLLDPQQDARLPVVQLGHLVIVEHGLLECLDVTLLTGVHYVLSELGFSSRREGDVLLGERLEQPLTRHQVLSRTQSPVSLPISHFVPEVHHCSPP